MAWDTFDQKTFVHPWLTDLFVDPWPARILRGPMGVPRKGVWTPVNMRAWTCKELRVKRDQTSCYLWLPFLGTLLVPSRHMPARLSACPPGPIACLRSVLIITIYTISNRGSQIPEPLLVFTSTCPLTVQMSQGLGQFFKIGPSKAGRTHSFACELLRISTEVTLAGVTLAFVPSGAW